MNQTFRCCLVSTALVRPSLVLRGFTWYVIVVNNKRIGPGLMAGRVSTKVEEAK